MAVSRIESVLILEKGLGKEFFYNVIFNINHRLEGLVAI